MMLNYVIDRLDSHYISCIATKDGDFHQHEYCDFDLFVDDCVIVINKKTKSQIVYSINEINFIKLEVR